MLSVEIALPDVEELHKLVEQGQEKGFLTYDEIVNALEDVELTKEQLEEFTTYATDHSIELVEGCGQSGGGLRERCLDRQQQGIQPGHEQTDSLHHRGVRTFYRIRHDSGWLAKLLVQGSDPPETESGLGIFPGNKPGRARPFQPISQIGRAHV